MVLGRGYCSASFGLSGMLLVSGGLGVDGEELQSAEALDVRMLKEWLPSPEEKASRQASLSSAGTRTSGRSGGGVPSSECSGEGASSGGGGGKGSGSGFGGWTAQSAKWAVVASSPVDCIPRADHASCFLDLPDTLV
jgi:hypothetical protein